MDIYNAMQISPYTKYIQVVTKLIKFPYKKIVILHFITIFIFLKQKYFLTFQYNLILVMLLLIN